MYSNVVIFHSSTPPPLQNHEEGAGLSFQDHVALIRVLFTLSAQYIYKYIHLYIHIYIHGILWLPCACSMYLYHRIQYALP